MIIEYILRVYNDTFISGTIMFFLEDILIYHVINYYNQLSNIKTELIGD